MKKRQAIPLFLLLFLLFAVGLAADSDDAAHGELVSISADVGGFTSGSGIVISVKGDQIFVLTAGHVVGQQKDVGVTLASDPFEVYPGVVERIDDSLDLALIRMEGEFPDLKVMAFDPIVPEEGQTLLAIGFPRRSKNPRIVSGSSSGREGLRLVFDRSLAEGTSGGPVLHEGVVVGLVQEIDAHFTYAIPSAVILRVLEGWQVEVLLGDSQASDASQDGAERKSLPQFLGVYALNGDQLTRLEPLRASSKSEIRGTVSQRHDVLSEFEGPTLLEGPISFVIYSQNLSRSSSVVLQEVAQVVAEVQPNAEMRFVINRTLLASAEWYPLPGRELSVAPVESNPSMMIRAIPESQIESGLWLLGVQGETYPFKVAAKSPSAGQLPGHLGMPSTTAFQADNSENNLAEVRAAKCVDRLMKIPVEYGFVRCPRPDGSPPPPVQLPSLRDLTNLLRQQGESDRPQFAKEMFSLGVDAATVRGWITNLVKNEGWNLGHSTDPTRLETHWKHKSPMLVLTETSSGGTNIRFIKTLWEINDSEVGSSVELEVKVYRVHWVATDFRYDLRPDLAKSEALATKLQRQIRKLSRKKK